MADLTYAVEVALGGTLTDITGDITGFSATTGRRKDFEAFQVGRCSFDIDDRDGAYVPNAGGSWSSETWLGREVKITATVDGVSQVLWRGHVDDVDVDLYGFYRATVSVSASGPLALLGQTAIDASTAFSSELSSVRIENVLDLSEVDSGYFTADTKDIQTGETTLQAESDAGGNTLQYLQTVEASEGGRLYVRNGGDVGGVLTFRPRSATSTDVAVTFADDGSGAPVAITDGGTAATSSFVETHDGGDAAGAALGSYDASYLDTYNGLDGGDAANRSTIPYEVAQFGFGADLLKNRAVYTRVGGTAQTAQDAASIARYDIRTVTKTGLLNETDADVLELAELRIARASVPPRNVESLSLLLDTLSDAEASVALSVGVGDLVRVVTSPPGYVSRGTLNSSMRVEQVAHRVSTGEAGTHSVQLRLTALGDEFGNTVDGGSAATSSFDLTYDGGVASTVSFARTVDGASSTYA